MQAHAHRQGKNGFGLDCWLRATGVSWLNVESDWLKIESDWLKVETEWLKVETDWLKVETDWLKVETVGLKVAQDRDRPVAREFMPAFFNCLAK